MMRKIIIMLAILASGFLSAQNILMPTNNNGGNGTRYVLCSGTLNDDGGPGNYSTAGNNGLAVICPGIATDRAQLDFFAMDIGLNHIITVFDGDSTAAPVLATISNTTVPPGLIQASAGNPTGCLTVRFVANGGTPAGGFRATIGCFDPCQTITTNLVTNPPADVDGIIRICQGDRVDFDGSAIFSSDGTGATYQWDLGNGNGLNPGQVQSETYANSGIYFVDFLVTDNTGCRDRESRDLIVQVSTDPAFNGTQAADTSICFGESTTITGVVTPQDFTITPSPPITGQTFLPDGSGVSYTTCVNVDLFPPGTLFNNASDLVDVFVNMEHSYLGDLDLSITAPNGATVSLHVYPSGGGTFLGIPIDPGPGPGTGFDYVFTEGPPATQTWQQIQASVATIPAGSYLPVDPFSNFIGTPMNGAWCINITDNLGSDDGYIFFWGLNFNPAIIPSDLTFTPTPTVEQWLADPSITATIGNTITVTPTVSGSNCYDFEFIDNFGCSYIEQVCINVEAEILSGVPTDIDICDPTGTITTVDLTTKNPEVLNGLNPAAHNITYHLTANDAENLTNPILTPATYTAISNPQTIWVTLQDTASLCLSVQSFIVTIGNPVYNAVADVEVCDDPSNDGFEIFDLTSQLAGILGTQNPASYVVTFHNSQLDADTGANPIATPATYANTTINNETVFVRIESTVDTTCNTTGTFDLIIAPSPTANLANDMVVCDDTSNDGIATFILSDQDAAILGTQNPADFTVSYHVSQADADANANPLNTAGYQNAGTGTETIFARIQSVTNGTCYNTTSFDITVDPLAIANAMNDLTVCDDATNDGFEIFNLTQNEVDLLGNQNPADFTITYHESQPDADANNNAIATPATFTNTTATQQTIFVRIQPNSNVNCYATGTFDLIIAPQPVANAPNDMVVCDDASNDGIETFVLSTQTTAILGTQNPANFAISFHNSQADADSDTAAIALAYDNITSPETVFVRVESLNNPLCVATTTFDLVVNPSPAIVTPSAIELCDDPSGDGVEAFDLISNETALLNGVDPTTVTISYHLSLADANSLMGAITSPYNNTAPTETIFVRVADNLTGCFNVVSYDLVLNEVPTINAAVSDLLECDDDNDGAALFTLTDRSTEILNGQSGISIEFYENLADATSATGEIIGDYTNVLNPQAIGYRLINDATGCFSIGTFDIEAVAAPVAVTPTPLENCAISIGGVATADLSIATTEITAAQTGVTVTYHESQLDAQNASNPAATSYDYNATTSLFIRIEDPVSGCVSFSTVDLVYNDLPVPTLLSQYVICLDPNGVPLDGPAALDTGLTTANYTFEWFQDTALIPGATSGTFNATAAGDYEVVVVDAVTGCSNTQTTNVRQSGIPTDFNVEVTSSTYDVDHQVIATATGPDEYWFRLDDGPYVNSGIFNNVSPGPHTVTIAERNGCGEIVVEVFVFGYPDFFTPNNDGFNDTWNIVGGDRLPGTTLYIFDRFGKLLKQLDVTGIGWDGTYNGEPMPSSDYWFRIDYVQDGSTNTATGHFALKR